MKIKLKEFNDKGEIISSKVCKDKADGLAKKEGMSFYQLHECYHDEVPPKPCKLIEQKSPVVVDA